jgi:hypothetical protein
MDTKMTHAARTEACECDLPALRGGSGHGEAKNAGVQVIRQVVEMPSLAEAEPAALIGRLRAMFELLIEPSCDQSARCR